MVSLMPRTNICKNALNVNIMKLNIYFFVTPVSIISINLVKLDTISHTSPITLWTEGDFNYFQKLTILQQNRHQKSQRNTTTYVGHQLTVYTLTIHYLESPVMLLTRPSAVIAPQTSQLVMRLFHIFTRIVSWGTET